MLSSDKFSKQEIWCHHHFEVQQTKAGSNIGLPGTMIDTGSFEAVPSVSLFNKILTWLGEWCYRRVSLPLVALVACPLMWS